ncbi:hypothetical protein [Anatilimnocola floriformis]|uniref:hypothetical protein n=1 Tax=Anatilimnocola floriformis TaxID=2948575 RepID=UPI0020C2BD11|nr:hypothetical protein [Anatilimnocola floriformis]
MKLIGVEFLANQIADGNFTAKVVFNHNGAIFFPVHEQHRDQKMPGLSYADESAGTALAGMVSPGKIEIRNHRDFSSERVTAIINQLLAAAELAALGNWEFTYRGQKLR